MRRVLVALGVVVALLTVTAFLWAHATLPRTEGTVTVAGISAPVEIARDRYGVPHIYGASEADAYFGLGYVHAQDRLWQMEASRRFGSGRLAEVFGARAVGIDRFMRTLGLAHYAEATLARLSPASQAILAAYSAGVNAYLAERGAGPLPAWLRLAPEFALLRHAPEPWRPSDSVLWIKVMAWDLGGNWRQELLRARLLRMLDRERVAEFLPLGEGVPPSPLPDLGALYAALPLDEIAAALPPETPVGASNDWVVAGSRTESGKPLLANDPHLGLSAPSVWYLAHVEAPGLAVIGATLPGVPGVVAGRTRRLAWGLTNTGPDVQDLFVERVDPRDPTRYLSPDGPLPFTTRDEVIGVRNGLDLVLPVRETRHGPVISDIRADAREIAGEGYAVALAWTALRSDDLSIQAGHEIARANNWREFHAALQNYHGPQQNIVYGDTEGTIALYAPARVPLRRSENLARGLVPVPGWNASYDWQGFIPYDRLPLSLNPKAGVIATANNDITGPGYPYLITAEWAETYRIRRIEALLAATSKHSVESFARVQGDLRSPMATDFLPLLLAADAAEPEAREARAMLARWEGTMTPARPEPLIFEAWYRELTRLVYADELGPLFDGAWRLRPSFLHNALTRQQHWCDDVTTPEPESCAMLVESALARALSALEQEHGPDMAAWRWGEAHFAKLDHAALGRVPVVGELVNIREPVGGDSFTINVARHSIGDPSVPFAAIHGPAFRAIYDLGEPDASRFIQSTGQSGNPFSPHYRDLTELWREVRYIPMTMDRRAIEADVPETLRLVPLAR